MPAAPERRAGPSGPSPLEWLYLALGLALVVRYRWLFDDAFVYFRYVDNLLFLGAGLTFNAGEYVEGFTSPAHCLLLTALRATGVGYPAIVVGIALVAFALFWWLLVRVNRELSPGGRALNLPLALLAASYSVTSFFTAGNEAPLVHVVAAANALFLLRPRSRALAAAVALAPLVRPELVLSTGATALWVWWREKRFPRWLVGWTAALNGAWLLFRAGYYADLLPNVFYLKVGTRPESGTNLEAGLRYLADATAPYLLPLAVAGALLLVGLLAHRRGARPVSAPAPRLALLAVAALTAGWVVVSGGSAMHYYYLAFPLTLAICALGGLAEEAAARRGRVAPVAMVALTALVLSRYPSKLSRHPLSGDEVQAELPSDRVMTDPSFFRRREPYPDQWPSIAELRAFAPTLRERGYGRWTDGAWCNTLYAHYDVRSVHPYGLTDAFLARIDTPEVKRGHKPALAERAVELIQVQARAGAVERGVYTDAIESGTAPAWMADHPATIAVLEAKVFQGGGLLENLRNALRFPPRIRL